MAKELIINATLPEVRIALMDDGQIQELLIERESEKGIVGNIYKGRVTRVLPGMQAAFVDIGLDKAAFLYVDDIYVHPQVMGEETELEADAGADASEETAEESTEESTEEVSLTEASEGTTETATEEGSTDDSAGDSADAPEVPDEFEEFEDSEDSEDSEEESDDDEEDDEEFEASSEESNSEAPSETPLEAGAETPSESVTSESEATASGEAGGLEGLQGQGRRGRRGRNRNRRRRRGGGEQRHTFAGGESHEDPNLVPQSFNESVNDEGLVESDRAAVAGESSGIQQQNRQKKARPEFREQRGRDRRIKSKALRPRAQANISDLLKEGQEVIVQAAKDPIATKGARLTCHVSLPGRHLVCMPSIDHVGVSRRIEREDERRRLRDFVERNRPRKMGFIVRTASGGKDPESWIKQDIDYLSKLWTGIRTKADEVSAPSMVYEDLNSTLRAIRDWVNEDVDRIVVDTRYHFNELQNFAERFMPTLIEKIELYQGDIPIFDAYGLSSELHRSMERKVWLKSGGYIVIDQAEALVAIDVNTGRFVGKKNLEDTILKTNLEAAEEIAYQLRLRNCGGIIIVDFIDMERDDNKMRVYRALDEALKKDRARPTIQKISELGLVEMTRKRTRDTLVRTLCEPCSHCEGRGYTKTYSTVAYEILREIERLSVDREAKKILVSAHEAVINVLAIELRDALDQLERRYNKSVYLQAVVDYHGEQFEVVSDRPGVKRAGQDIARQLRIERERSERKEKSKPQPRQDRDRERDRERDRDRERTARAPQEQAPKPVIRPSGAFISPPKPVVAAPVISETGAGESGEDRQPQFESSVAIPAEIQPTHLSEPDFSEMDDEDQLAYLRAQAAQDAAIAGIAGAAAPAGGNANRQGRGGHPPRNGNHPGNSRNRNRGRNGGQNQNHNQNQHNRGQRFRPQGGGNRMTEPVDAPVAQYEASGRSDDGSES